ncbi:hypothetical protein ElyMa_001782900 [Elysia marginata]|uniref:SWIM-type domain-containing protein n=1 Tax=Elysia marginata TaxID=1093978 RepID=A0AAV4EEC5_9GAST|nr:hypothetical protein ElyMa_001782900 [Elysia marginata]
MRRPSQETVITEARNSPHLSNLHADPNGSERRKSMLPPLAPGQGARQSLRPGMTFAMAAKKAKVAAAKNVELEREKSGFMPPAKLEPTYRMEPKRTFHAPQTGFDIVWKRCPTHYGPDLALCDHHLLALLVCYPGNKKFDSDEVLINEANDWLSLTPVSSEETNIQCQDTGKTRNNRQGVTVMKI